MFEETFLKYQGTVNVTVPTGKKELERRFGEMFQDLVVDMFWSQSCDMASNVNSNKMPYEYLSTPFILQ